MASIYLSNTTISGSCGNWRDLCMAYDIVLLYQTCWYRRHKATWERNWFPNVILYWHQHAGSVCFCPKTFPCIALVKVPWNDIIFMSFGVTSGKLGTNVFQETAFNTAWLKILLVISTEILGLHLTGFSTRIFQRWHIPLQSKRNLAPNSLFQMTIYEIKQQTFAHHLFDHFGDTGRIRTIFETD